MTYPVFRLISPPEVAGKNENGGHIFHAIKIRRY